MPALASLEELCEVYKKIDAFKKKHPQASEELHALLKSYRKIGYKNICKLFIGEATPESLKE